MKRLLTLSCVVMTIALAAACANQKVPAEAALKAADDAFAAVKVEGAKYVPDQTKAIEDALASAKDTLAKGEYEAVIKSAGEIPAKVTALSAAVAAKKTELTTSWAGFEAVPQMVAAIQSRVDMLGKSKKLPKGSDAAAFDQAKTGLADATKTWADAKAAFTGGDLMGAVDKAKSVKAAAEKIMASLNMNAAAPAAAAPAVKK